MNENIPCEECQNVLELVIITMCRHFFLKPKQAAGFLVNNNK